MVHACNSSRGSPTAHFRQDWNALTKTKQKAWGSYLSDWCLLQFHPQKAEAASKNKREGLRKIPDTNLNLFPHLCPPHCPQNTTHTCKKNTTIHSLPISSRNCMYAQIPTKPYNSPTKTMKRRKTMF